MTDSLSRSREFAARTPDFNESLLRAHEEGFTLADESVEHLKKTDRLDVGYFVSKKENRSVRDKLHNLTKKPQRQIAELDRIAAQIDRQGTFKTVTEPSDEVTKYLEKRREDFASGKRRRR